METGKKYYTKEHLWIRIKDGDATIGVTAFGLKDLGKLVLVDLPSENDEVSEGDEIAFLEGAKGTYGLYSPVDGVISRSNEELLDRPELLNDQSDTTFILAIYNDDGFDTGQWLSEKEYSAYIKNL